MKRTLILVLLAGVAGAGIAVWITREEKQQLVQELENARQEKTKMESQPAGAAPEPEPPNSIGSEPAKVGVPETELLRLRGEAARTARAEAEIAELRRELARAQNQGGPKAGSDSPVQDTLTTYLGSRVDPPGNLDPRYTKDGMVSAIQLAAQKAQISLRKLSVDDSEFPFLLGVTTDPGDWSKLTEQLKQLEGYEFHGSVGNETSHTLCPVPSRAYPSETAQNIRRRMNSRLEQFYSSFTAAQN